MNKNKKGELAIALDKFVEQQVKNTKQQNNKTTKQQNNKTHKQFRVVLMN
jgi:hypothetical protein